MNRPTSNLLTIALFLVVFVGIGYVLAGILGAFVGLVIAVALPFVSGLLVDRAAPSIPAVLRDIDKKP